jgi:hypothetical protein
VARDLLPRVLFRSEAQQSRFDFYFRRRGTDGRILFIKRIQSDKETGRERERERERERVNSGSGLHLPSSAPSIEELNHQPKAAPGDGSRLRVPRRPERSTSGFLGNPEPATRSERRIICFSLSLSLSLSLCSLHLPALVSGWIGFSVSAGCPRAALLLGERKIRCDGADETLDAPRVLWRGGSGGRGGIGGSPGIGFAGSEPPETFVARRRPGCAPLNANCATSVVSLSRLPDLTCLGAGGGDGGGAGGGDGGGGSLESGPAGASGPRVRRRWGVGCGVWEGGGGPSPGLFYLSALRRFFVFAKAPQYSLNIYQRSLKFSSRRMRRKSARVLYFCPGSYSVIKRTINLAV